MPGARVAVLVAVSTLRHPTVPGVAAATGLPRATVYGHLLLLRQAGWVTWEPGLSGTLRSAYTAHRPLETR